MANEKETAAGQKKDGIKVRYFVCGEVIYEAVNLQMNGVGRWFYSPFEGYYCPIDRENENRLFDTREEAERVTDANKAKKEREEEEKDKKKQERLDEVTKFLKDLYYYDYISKDDDHVLRKGRMFVDAVKQIYRDLPRKEKTDTEEGYTEMLEEYIVHGVINTQGLAFRPSQIQSVRYGEDGSVKLTLAEGTTVIPKSKSVTRLIKVIFGDNDDGWTYNDVEYPEGEYDTVDNDE